MARTTLTATVLNSRAGIVDPTDTAGIVDGHQFSHTGKEIIRVRNSHATVARNLSIRLATTVDGIAVPSRVVSIPATSGNPVKWIGPFTPDYKQSTNSMVWIDEDAGNEADLHISVFRLP